MNALTLAKTMYATNDPSVTGYRYVERLAQLQRAIRLIHMILLQHQVHLAADSTDLTCTAGTATVALPSDFLALFQHGVVGRIISVEREITLASPVDLDTTRMQASGVPEVGALVGSNIELGPIPGSAYSIKFRYFTTPPTLSETGYIVTENSGAEECLEASDTPWSGALDSVLVPTVERLLMQRNEYNTEDLIREVSMALNPILEMLQRNRVHLVSTSGPDWSGIGPT